MRDLLRLMGFDVAMEAVGPSFARANEGIGGRTPEFDDIWQRTAADVFPPGKLFEAHAIALAPQFSDAEWQELMDYFQTGLGARATELENIGHSSEGEADKAVIGDALVADTLSDDPERMALIDRMIRVLSTEEESLAYAMNISYAMAMGLSSTGQLPAQTTESQILEMLQAQAPEMRKSLRTNAIRSNIYTYRALSNEELEAYIDFLARDPAKKLYDGIHAETARLIPPLVERFGQTVMEKMGTSPL
ncbi:MAG: hypothetical protein AAF393_01675 [Pseudomonadota bacterium]